MPQNDLKLILVNIFHRHGERAALKIFEKPLGELKLCTHKNEYFELSTNSSYISKISSFIQKTNNLFFQKPTLNLFSFQIKLNKNNECASSQLTDIGKRTLHDFGKELRKQYIKTRFLSPEFDQKEVFLQSTEFPRTIQSLQCLVRGLFQKTKTPVEINILQRAINSEYSAHFCKKFLKEASAYKQDVLREHEKESNLVVEAFEKFLEKKGVKTHLKLGPYDIFDVIMSSLGNKQKLFLSFNKKILNIAEKISLKMYYKLCEKNQNIMMYRGAYIRDLHDRIKSRILGQDLDKKLYITSGHDTTIYPLLCAFKLDDNRWPKFGANLVFETFEAKDGKFYIRTKYNGKILSIPHCQNYYDKEKTLCLAQDFFRICKKFSIKNRQEICDSE